MRLTQSENWKVAMSGREGISPQAGDRSTVQFIVREVPVPVRQSQVVAKRFFVIRSRPHSLTRRCASLRGSCMRCSTRRRRGSMSSNGAGRASGHGVGCRGNVISVFAPRRRLMSSQARFSFHSSRLFFQYIAIGIQYLLSIPLPSYRYQRSPFVHSSSNCEVTIEVLMRVRAGKLAVASSLYRIRQPPPCAAERSPLSPNCSSPSLSHMKPCSR